MSSKPVFNVPILKSQHVQTDSIKITGGAGNTRVLACGANGFGVWVDTADILPNLSSNSVVITNQSGNLLSSNVSVLDLQNATAVASLFPGHVHSIANVTGLQTVLNNTSAVGHTHAIANVTGLQLALDAKQPFITGAASTITSSDLTASRALVTSTGGKVTASNATAAELDCLSGVSSSIQTQLNTKQGVGSYANAVHVHAIAAISNLSTTLDSKANLVHSHDIGNITNLQALLDQKSAVGHTHVISDVIGLPSVLSGKADSAHTHAMSDITGLETQLASKLNASGTVTLNGTLAITGTSNATFGGNSYAFLTLSGNTALVNVTNTAPVSVSISATQGAVQAAQFISLSDARLKTISSSPDSVDIAVRCSGITPKLWRYKDALEYDGRERFGFVAQDVEAAGLGFAITRTSRFVPSIYKLSHRSTDGFMFDCEAHGLLPGDHLQYYTVRSAKPMEGKVIETTKTAFRLEPQPPEETIFVYGPRCDDVKSIDYNAMCAAAFMCIADLRRRLETLEGDYTAGRA